MSTKQRGRGMGEYLEKAVERDEHGNAKSPGRSLVETAVRQTEQRVEEFERVKGLRPAERRGMGRYLDR